jgi:hypothetical protein
MIRVGEYVWFVFAHRNYTAKVIEDRGNIGVDGRRLLRLRTRDGSEFELPETELINLGKAILRK